MIILLLKMASYNLQKLRQLPKATQETQYL